MLTRLDIDKIEPGMEVIADGVHDELTIDMQRAKVIKVSSPTILLNFFDRFSSRLGSGGVKNGWYVSIHRVDIYVYDDDKYVSYRLSVILPYIGSKASNFKMLYLDVTDSDDKISYLDKRYEDITEDPYRDKRRKTIRVGRFLKRLFPNHSEQRIESMVNKYKALWKKNYADLEFKLVQGEDIRKYYNEDNYVNIKGGNLSKSCMRYRELSKLFDIYVENPDVCKLLILRYKGEEKIIGRSLVWKLYKPSGKIYMDRVYTAYDSDANLFYSYAHDHGWLSRHKDSHVEMIVKLQTDKDYGTDRNNPYMDTFARYNPRGNFLGSRSNKHINYRYFFNNF